MNIEKASIVNKEVIAKEVVGETTVTLWRVWNWFTTKDNCVFHITTTGAKNFTLCYYEGEARTEFANEVEQVKSSY